jgi:hypothetical protein
MAQLPPRKLAKEIAMITDNTFNTRIRLLGRPYGVTPVHLETLSLLMISARVKKSFALQNMYEREQIAEAIEKHQHKGKVALIIWQRDCDCAEWTERSIVKADVFEILHRMDRVYANAEGPVSWHITSPKKDFQPESHDRVLEAFENGSYYSV